MKKLFVIFLVSLFLFSCSISQLTDAMGKMGQNVMGDYVNSEAVDKAKEAATNVKPEDTKKDESGNTELTAITDKDGNSIKVNLGDKNVTSILPSLSEDTKSSIIEAASSEGGAKSLVETLNGTSIQDDNTKKAAKGTATVLSAVLTDMTKSGTLSAAASEAKAAIENLTSNLDKLADDSSEVTAADVIALQAVTALVNQIASSATIDETSGTITKVDISTDDNIEIVSSALDTVTVIQAVNPASIITADDFETLIKAITKNESSRDLHNIDTKWAESIRSFYSIYTKLFGDSGISKNKVSVMSLYSGATDLYIGLNGDDRLSGQVADVDRILQYAISALFSKAEYIYSEKAKEVFDGEYPSTLAAFIDNVVEKNPWIADSEIEVTDFNDELGFKYKEDKDYKSLVNEILKELVSTGNTIKLLCSFVELDNIKTKINQIPDFLNTGLDYEWK